MSFSGFGMRHLIAIALLLATLGGCVNHRETLQLCYRQADAGRYDEALATLERSALAKNGRDRLLYLLERGQLLRRQGDYRGSNEVFEAADRLQEKLFTRSLSAESLSFLTNDRIIPYAGEDYEAVYLNYFKALNYLALNDLEGALVECRRIDEKLNYYSDSYGSGTTYREDAFLRLLTGLIYEADGASNDAFIAYRKSLEAYRASRGVYGVEVPTLLWGRLLAAAQRTGFDEEYRAYREEARLAGVEPLAAEPVAVVLINRGLLPAKREVAAFFPTPNGFPVKLAFPQLGVSTPPGRLDLRLNGEPIIAERVQDLAAVARQSLQDRQGRRLAKMIARAVAKQLAARQAEKELGPLAGLTAQIGALLTEQADLRAWTSLPDDIRMAVVALPPGAQTVTLNDTGSPAPQYVDAAGRSLVFVTFRTL